MNEIWSTRIQGVETLYRSRSLRFGDRFSARFIKAFDIGGRRRILEAGCGPGALSGALSRWYPEASVTGIDLDAGFIRYASKKLPGVRFVEGDITAMPFKDGSFDAVISNTVSEHVEPSLFYKEQYRVLGEGGVCIVMSSRKSITVRAKCVAEESDLEKNVWAKTEKDHNALFERYGVGAFFGDESFVPLNMEKYGFKNVSVSYFAVDLTPDDPVNDKEAAYAIIDSERYNDLESAGALLLNSFGLVTAEEIAELKSQIDRKYDKRKELYDAGIRQWDTTVSVIMAVRGVKQS